MRLLIVVASLLVATGAGAQTLEHLARSSLAQIDGRVALHGLRDSVEVIRDRWGVPHIYARNMDDLFFAQGFVQAQDRLWQMEMYRRTHEGTLAEIMGPAYVRHDRLARLLKYRGPFDDSEWKSYHPEGRRIFDAFANGVNAFIAQAGDRLHGEPGDWLLQYGPGDFGIVGDTIFAQTYEVLGPGPDPVAPAGGRG